MKLPATIVMLMSMWSLLQAQTAASPNSGVHVRGHVVGLPVDAPFGLIAVDLIGPRLTMTTPIRSDGTFEFTNVPPVRILLRTSMLRTGIVTLTLADKDVDGIELIVTSPQVLGQVVLDGGGRLPTNRDPLLPVLKLEARGTGGNVVSHQFVHSDGTFGFLPLPPDDYNIRVTLVPEGYSVKSISYAGADVLRTPVKLSGPAYSFMRITLSAVPVSESRSPGDVPAVAQTAPAIGNAMLVVSQSGMGPPYTEGSLAFFRLTSASPAFREEKRLGGESCFPPPAAAPPGMFPLHCDPTGPNASDSLAFSLPAGDYEITGFVRPCDGNCGMLDAATNECRASFSIRAGETLYAERISNDTMCTLAVSSKPRTVGTTP